MDIPEREWIVQGLIPSGTLTLLTGAGGDGKTLLAQQIATAVSAGTHIFGMATTRTPVIGLYSEDDTNELTRRQQAILRVDGVDPAEARDYHYRSLIGEDTSLGSFDNGKNFRPSALLQKIRATALHLGCRFIVLDNVTQMFSGDFNDRTPVTAFLRALSNLASEINGAVLLLGHVAKSEGSTYAGSASWRDSVRSLITIERGAKMVGVRLTALERDYRTITQHKANYGAGGDSHLLRWHEGAFVAASPDLGAADDASNADKFLGYLRTLTERKQSTSPSNRAANYAPKMMEKEFRASRTYMEAAMESLLEDGVLVEGELPWTSSSRHAARGLVEVPPTPKPANDFDSIMASISQRAGK
jgi:RecA-family ATPase